MCGIAGVMSLHNHEVDEARLKKMTDAIRHRGPDGDGQWINATCQVGLAHRRLSIIDLSETGKQPMHYAGRYTITFNGEIYNYIELRQELEKNGYQFHSTSDTEVLMAMYDYKKENCLEYLDGMFAFAIWDEKAKQVFCARDRFGEKPFYYSYERGKHFVFASEMKALWAGGVSKSVDTVMLYNYLNNGFVYNPGDLSQTFYSGISKLKAAHYLIVNEKLELVEKKYWKLSENKTWEGNFEQACEKFKALFTDSVNRRLRSDVPVGSSLSGGLDSSLVVCTIDEIRKREQRNQVQKTFSARFPGFAKDEGRFMQMVIERCSIEPHFTYPGEKDLLDNIDRLFYHQEEPFTSASIFVQYAVMQLAHEQGVTVLLDGQGADELLAGYHFYFRKYFQQIRRSKTYSTEYKAWQQMHQPSPQTLRRLWLDINVRPFMDLPARMKQRLRSPQFITESFAAHGKEKFYLPEDGITLNQSLIYSATQGPLEELLRYADRNSMAHSREVRLPFLYHELAEFLINIPADYKIHEGWTKFIMRKAGEEVLPKEITWRKDKIGYEPPQRDWMKSDVIREKIVEGRKKLVQERILNKEVLKAKVNAVAATGASKESSWKHWMAANLFS
ncbi:MAG: asparagine synthase (glutamine-hydrolyzing) [Flavisolibacter sp.]